MITPDELVVVQERLEVLLNHPDVLKYDATSFITRDTLLDKILLFLKKI